MSPGDLDLRISPADGPDYVLPPATEARQNVPVDHEAGLETPAGIPERWRITPEEASLRSRLTPEAVKRELPPLVERAFEGNEDLREHIERILALDRSTVRSMLASLKDRQLEHAGDEDLRRRLTDCMQFLQTMGIDTDKPIPDATPEEMATVPLSPTEPMNLGKSWESITFKPAYAAPGSTDTGGVTAEINVSFRTWWDRNRDLLVPPDDTAKRAVDYDDVRFKQQMSAFMETYFAYQTNGLADSPSSITVRLTREQASGILDFLKQTGGIAAESTGADELGQEGITVARDRFADMDAANTGLLMDTFARIPKMGFWHGWGGNRTIGQWIATQNPNFAFVSFDAMGSAGNRIHGPLAGLRDPAHPFSLEDYGRNQQYARDAMFRTGDIIRGWSMGGEALALSLVYEMRQLEQQLGQRLTPHVIDQLVEQRRLTPVIHIAEARATADLTSGITSCDFLRPNPLESIMERLGTVQSRGLIELGHALQETGIAGLPGVGAIVGSVTEFQGGRLLKHDTAQKKTVLDVHTGNLNTRDENRNIKQQTDAILRYEGMTADDMRLLALAKHLHPVLEITGKEDALTDEKIQRIVNRREARIAEREGCAIAPIVSMHDDHSLMAGREYLSFPFESLQQLPPEVFSRCIEVLHIEAKLKANPPVPLTPRETTLREHYTDESMQPDASRLVAMEAPLDAGSRPLGARIQQKREERRYGPDIVSGFIHTMVTKNKQAAVTTLIGYLRRQDIVFPDVHGRTEPDPPAREGHVDAVVEAQIADRLRTFTRTP
jgi:hypothetical protein